MPAPDKPRHRSGYSAEEFEQVKSACLTVAVTLGAYLEDVCIVGGLVPALLIDTTRDADTEDDAHSGTNELDVGLALAVLDDDATRRSALACAPRASRPTPMPPAIRQCSGGVSAIPGSPLTS